MKKKLTLIMIASLLAINLVGCGEEKIVNKSIVTEATITDFGHCGYRNGNATIVTDKGEFYFSDDIDMYSQILDIYKLNKSLKKDVVIDVVYYNNETVDNKIFKIKEIIVVK